VGWLGRGVRLCLNPPFRGRLFGGKLFGGRLCRDRLFGGRLLGDRSGRG
jgi:hypothetical protein